MTNRIARRAVTASTILVASVLLVGCAGDKHTFSGTEVSKLDKTIEALDNAWSQHRANGTAANVSDDSRCFVQKASDGVLADKALCGPVHYLGVDDTTWDSVNLSASPDDADKVTLGGSSFQANAMPGANTTLYRSDGKKPSESTDLPEPDTKAAASEQAIWNGSGGTTEGKGTVVKTPEVEISVSLTKVSDRIGGVSDRLKAGDGHKFGTASVNFTDTRKTTGLFTGPSTAAVQTELAFVSGGKTYPIGKLKSGTVAMAVPGDGKDLALAVTYDGLTQTVGLSDTKLYTTATAYYDGIATTAKSRETETVKVGDSNSDGFYKTIEPLAMEATRSAYNPKAGWAPEGKAWLRVTFRVPGHNIYWNSGSRATEYDSTVEVSSATVKNVSGQEFTAPIKLKDVTRSGFRNNLDSDFILLFEVPAAVSDFSLDTVLNVGGPKGATDAPAAPATASLDMPIEGVELSFPKQ
jgi:outer membrane murein-binding lipoprotein Lpp